MAIGGEQRRRERAPRVAALFSEQDRKAALDLLDMADMAWHDCYFPELEVEPTVLDDILLLSHGDLATLVRVALAAIIDFRDVRIAADEERAGEAR